eukprot:8095345-Pyramimonas_sp.AAC.4
MVRAPRKAPRGEEASSVKRPVDAKGKPVVTAYEETVYKLCSTIPKGKVRGLAVNGGSCRVQ